MNDSPSVSGVTCGHHVFSVKHLRGQFGNSYRFVLLRSTRSQGSKAGHEKVKTGKRDLNKKYIGHVEVSLNDDYHVHSKFTKIGVELTRKTETGSDA